MRPLAFAMSLFSTMYGAAAAVYGAILAAEQFNPLLPLSLSVAFLLCAVSFALWIEANPMRRVRRDRLGRFA